MTQQRSTGHTIKTHVAANADDASRIVAAMMLGQLDRRADSVLGLATGGTPTNVYDILIRDEQSSPRDWSKITAFNLDEYIGLVPTHPQSFHAFMKANLFDGLRLTDRQTHVPPGIHDDFAVAAADYEAAIRAAGGIDFQILGIGENGHIAFNEPGSAGNSRTRVVDLTEDTIQANARFFDSADDVPRTAISMGIGTILEARQIVLLAFGPQKADAVRAAVEGPVTPACPASFLQTHSDVTFVLDEDAANQLTG